MIVTIDGLNKSYNKHLVLKNILLEFKEGEIYCIVGKNGAGKSTLFNLMTSFIKPDSGTIKFDNVVYPDLPIAIKQKIGFMSDVSSLIEELNAYQYLSLIGQFYNLNKKMREDQIAKLLNFFFSETTSIHKTRIKSFSTGMKKKLEICASCLHLPDFLILDEPFSGIDPIAAQNVITFFSQYREPYRTILFSSHNLDYIEKINPVLIILDEFSIKFYGKISEFVKSFDNKFHESLLIALNYKKVEQDLKWR